MSSSAARARKSNATQLMKLFSELRAAMASDTKDVVSDLLKKAEDQMSHFKQAQEECLAEMTDEEQKQALMDSYSTMASAYNDFKEDGDEWLDQFQRREIEEERADLQRMMEAIKRERQLLKEEKEQRRIRHMAATSTMSPNPFDTTSTDDSGRDDGGARN